MTHISFDMRRTGAIIAQLRREHNMTQMQLADEMGVSFQAVSNWERGQSMPDISKLPELAALLNTTIDHLLGRRLPILEAAAAGTLADTPVTPSELAEAAPLLRPDQMATASAGLTNEDIDPALLHNLLPFLNTEKVDDLLHRAAAQDQDISSFLPFASEDVISRIAREKTAKGEDICYLLPFMDKDTIDELARQKAAKGESFVTMLPFMYEDTIDELAVDRIRRRERIDELLPFLSGKLIDRLADLSLLDA